MKYIIHQYFFKTKRKRFVFISLLCLFYLILASCFAFYWDNPSLGIMIILNGLLLFFLQIHTYEVTSEKFVWYRIAGLRKKSILLSAIDRVEVRYTKQRKIKSLIVRFFNGKYRNFTIIQGECGEDVLIALKKIKPELEVLVLESPIVRRR
jgi:hypothetical protein